MTQRNSPRRRLATASIRAGADARLAFGALLLLGLVLLISHGGAG